MNSNIVYSIAAALMSVIYLAYLLYFRNSSTQRAKYTKLIGGDKANMYDTLFSVKKIIVASCLALIFIANLTYQLVRSDVDSGGIVLFTLLILAVFAVTFLIVFNFNKPRN